ncbi:hypothetical protein ACN47E_006930 [Coniothyrium glycines]
MTWWRRDPSISPINRYAQRLLRSHESALRTRCFSRSPSQSAQHEDNDDSKRPSGMSNLEWMQMQHYNRWRKRFTDDPYRALFGASHDMLNGKGLKDWEWIGKTFPRWMSMEMEAEEGASKQSRQSKINAPSPQGPKRVEIAREQDATLYRRESYFRQSSTRATRLDRDYTSGIESPLDLRRPREQPHLKFVWQHQVNESTSESDAKSSTPDRNIAVQSTQDMPHEARSVLEDITENSSNKSSSKEGRLTDSTFTEQFLADQYRPSDADVQPRRSIWRETALQRRATQATTPSSASKIDYTIIVAEERSSLPSSSTLESTVEKAIEIPPSIAPQGPELATARNNVTRLEEPCTKPRSTSELLSQLPKDDIDFLSADEIRASMGSKKIQTIANEQKHQKRQELEATFNGPHSAGQNIDPLIESKIIEDQRIRRLERELQSPKDEPLQSLQYIKPSASTSPCTPEAPIESTVDRLVNLVSSHFWQTPGEPESIKKTKIFFDQFMVRVRRGRNAMKQIVEDLEKDIPASKDLLKALQEHDEMLDSTVRRLQCRLDSGDRQATTSNQKANEKLRIQIKHTDRRLDAAFAALNEVEIPKNILPSYKRRLRTASRVATRNLELTRQIAWGMQTHLEDPEIDRTVLSGYQTVANTLVVVNHTQLALTLLLDRAMLVYGVPKVGGGGAMPSAVDIKEASPVVESTQPLAPVTTEVDKAQLRAKIAAEERLAHEVDAQLSAMKGLSDDGYAREPKVIARKPFEDQRPLSHSLFRPFGPIVQSLGKDLSSEAMEAEEAANNRASDAKLVAEVRQAYEDTYGPITVGHRQLADASEKIKEDHSGDVKAFTLLKEDNISHNASSEQSSPAEALASDHRTHSSSIAPAADEYAGTASQNTDNSTVASQTTTEFPVARGSDAVSAQPEMQVIKTESKSTLSPISHYTILVHDPETGNLSMTTSIAEPHDSTPPMPLHQALATLSNPAKFIPFINDGLEVHSASPHMLVLRDALNETSSTRSFETVSASTKYNMSESDHGEPSIVNPIDGTTRLSPTGYVGPEESHEQLEREFEERSQAAGRLSAARKTDEQGQTRSKSEPRKRRGAGGVVKTAIWAAAACYVAGVIGEIATSA